MLLASLRSRGALLENVVSKIKTACFLEIDKSHAADRSMCSSSAAWIDRIHLRGAKFYGFHGALKEAGRQVHVDRPMFQTVLLNTRKTCWVSLSRWMPRYTAA